AWFVANREAPGAAAGEEFLQWLRKSPMHVEEYLGVTQVARDLMACAPQAQSSIDALVERARREADSVVRSLDAPAPRRRAPGGAGAGGGGAAGGALAAARGGRGDCGCDRCRDTAVAAHGARTGPGGGHGAAPPDTTRRAAHAATERQLRVAREY